MITSFTTFDISAFDLRKNRQLFKLLDFKPVVVIPSIGSRSIAHADDFECFISTLVESYATSSYSQLKKRKEKL